MCTVYDSLLNPCRITTQLGWPQPIVELGPDDRNCSDLRMLPPHLTPIDLQYQEMIKTCRFVWFLVIVLPVAAAATTELRRLHELMSPMGSVPLRSSNGSTIAGECRTKLSRVPVVVCNGGACKRLQDASLQDCAHSSTCADLNTCVTLSALPSSGTSCLRNAHCHPALRCIERHCQPPAIQGDDMMTPDMAFDIFDVVLGIVGVALLPAVSMWSVMCCDDE